MSWGAAVVPRQAGVSGHYTFRNVHPEETDIMWGKFFRTLGGGIKKFGEPVLSSIVGQWEPHVAMLSTLIDQIQANMPTAPGADKAATFDVVSDAILASQLAGLTPDQQAEFKRLRSQYRDLMVQARHVAADVEDATQQLVAFIATIKAEKTNTPLPITPAPAMPTSSLSSSSSPTLGVTS